MLRNLFKNDHFDKRKLRFQTLKGLNSILESGDEHHQQIKHFVISGIRKLALYANDPEKSEFKAIMSKFAPNYLKTLLELYRTKV